MYSTGWDEEVSVPSVSSDVVRTESDPEYIVVGAGLAGLSAAVSLHRAGKEVLLIDRGDSVGGRVRTDFEAGFTLDRGFQVLLTSYPELQRHLDLSSLDLRPFIRGANVWDADRFIEVSDPRSSLRGAVNALTTTALTAGDRIRFVKLALRLQRSKSLFAKRSDDCSTGELLERLGFSQRSIATLWEPLLSGIQLTSSLEGSARLASLILRCLIRGPAAVPAGGMQEIPRQMASNLPESAIRLGSEIEGVHNSQVFLAHGEKLSARRIVVATEQKTAARLLGEEPVATRSQWHAYFVADEPPNDSRAIHLMSVAQGPCRNLAIMSNVVPEYAPQGKSLIVVAGPTSGLEAPVYDAQQQLKNVFGNQVSTWQVLKAGIVAGAQPVFSPGSPLTKKKQKRTGILVAGDHRTTPSIQGALVSGRITAEAAINDY